MMHLNRFLVVSLMGLAVVGCDGEPDEDELCHGPDGTLEPGETYGDACNMCTCNEDRTISCEETDACAACDYEGTGYQVGDTWPAGDGCNICQCEADGNYSCTETACG